MSGQFGNAVSFDAVNKQALRVNGVNFANKSFTLSTWLKSPGGSPSGAIISQGGLGHVNPGGAVILGANNGKIYCDLWQLNSSPNLSAPIGDNGWHQWACTFDLPTRQMTLYRDGAVVDTTRLQGLPSTAGRGRSTSAKPIWTIQSTPSVSSSPASWSGPSSMTGR
ncbi:MAG: LamG-like jellyroll fold domain-containing protein [Caldilineaceae bacterium]